LVPFWVGLGPGEDPVEAEEVALRARLQAGLDVVEDYATLTPFEQQRRYALFRSRLCDRFDDERRGLRHDDVRLRRAVDE
jgi:hypothetical protein